MLRAQETEQLGRVADRIRKERRVLAFLACEDGARFELPGTAFEKALAAAELGTLLLDRGYHFEAVDVCHAAIEPFLKDGVHDAGRGTIAYLVATFSAALAAVGAVSSARSLAEASLGNLVQTGAATEDDLTAFVDALEPTAPSLLADARVLHGSAADLGWEPFQRRLGVSLAEEIARSGTLRQWRPKHGAFSVDASEPEARAIVALARGEIGEATGSFDSAAAEAAHRDEDNRWQLLRAVDSLLFEGDVRCAAALLGRLRRARATDWLPLCSTLRSAWVLALLRRVEKGCALVRFKERPAAVLEGVVYQYCATLAGIVVNAAGARQCGADRITDTDSYLSTVLDWLPSPDEGTPPFYRILFPGLRADLLALLPERRAEAVDLARGAWELASAEYPRYAPDHAAKLARCLLRLDRLDETLDVLSAAEREAESLESLRSLAALRLLRVAAHARRGEGPAVASAMAALRETLDATGSARIAAESLLSLARGLPPACTRPDVLALADESSELFADMPIVAGEELCRETRGDALLARGRREEAAVCFAAAAKRLRHHGLLLRLPLLRAKRRTALGEGPAQAPAGEAPG